MLASLVLALVQTTEVRTYRAWLTNDGGWLPFGLELRCEATLWKAFLINGEERIEVPRVEFEGDRLLLDMPHYDSRIQARVLDPLTGELDGTWEKRRSKDGVAQVPFHARSVPPGVASAPKPSGSIPVADLTGRWWVRFDSEEEPAVCVLEQRGAELRGTFLTSTGDYRYLSGNVEMRPMPSCMTTHVPVLTLSCFDGAHAFLFRASGCDSLQGDFWSGNWHHETWTAKRDDSAQLADAFAQTKWNGTTKLTELSFPDLEGKKHALSEFAGKATLLVVFGSWCPNCNDEAKLLKELDAKYRARGLRILPLAFELTGEFARDAAQVRLFQQRHALALPFFLCGTADKDEATKALGLVDRVRAFPTTVFVGADGLVKAVHSGFAGPATGEEHAKLVREFEQRLEALLR